MRKISDPVYSDGIVDRTITKFGGLNHTPAAFDGEIYDLGNMTYTDYPFICSRSPFTDHNRGHKVLGIAGRGTSLYYVVHNSTGNNAKLFCNGVELCTLTGTENAERFLSFIGGLLIIFPDKMYFNVTDYESSGGVTKSYGSLEASVTSGMTFGDRVTGEQIIKRKCRIVIAEGQSVLFDDFSAGDCVKIQGDNGAAYNDQQSVIIREISADSTVLLFDADTFNKNVSGMTVKITKLYASAAVQFTGAVDFTDYVTGDYVTEEKCALTIPNDVDADFSAFRVGDSVSIHGTLSANDTDGIIIRDISSNKKELYFYPNSFAENGAAFGATVSRSVPDLDFIFTHNNRIFGAKGVSIYGSALGDPFNFNVFDGLSTDSYYLETEPNDGYFTGGISYQGYPTFFKEFSVTKVYGSDPNSVQSYTIRNILSCQSGSAKSVVVINSYVYMLSSQGVVRYNGSYSSLISAGWGNPEKFSLAKAGTDGRCYYINVKDDTAVIDDDRRCYFFDTFNGNWYVISDHNCGTGGFAYADGLFGASCVYGDHAVNGITEIGYHREHPFDGGITESFVHSFVEFGDFFEASPDYKSTAKIILRIALSEGSSVDVYASYDGAPYIPIEHIEYRDYMLSGDGIESREIAFRPQRCDHFRIKIEAVNFWRLMSLTRQISVGSAER